MHIPSGCSKIENSIIIDKIKGLIFGAILGDSIGIATEGMKRDEVKTLYGKGPIRFGMDEDGMPFTADDYRSFFDENDYGANTEQVLLVVESVLENNGYLHSKDLASRLSEHKANFHHFKDTNSALVRAPLLGALKFWDGTSVIENSTYSCQMTHPNPSCMISSVVISILIARLLRGQNLEIQLQPTPIPTPIHSPILTDYSIDSLTTDQTLQALVRDVIETNKRIFQSSFFDSLPATDIIHQLISCSEPNTLASLHLENSDDAFYSLGAALYCFTRSISPHGETESFKRIIMDIVMQGGRAQNNATTAGALLGARVGYSQLPTEWVVGMKRWEWLEDKIDEFCALF